MILIPRKLARPLFLLLSLGLALPASGQKTLPVPRASLAQSGPAAPAAPPVADKQPSWLYVGSDITPDPDWHFGVLPNGLRYAARRNGVPPGQVAVRVRIDAGSLFETDSERGFAHLIEHLSFRGSVYVPDGEAKRVWQRMGTTFGSDTNAQTSPTGTTYKLDLPGATPDGLDESLKILFGMMSQPNITDYALNAERPVVLAEQREQPGPQVRIGDALRQTFFAGQPLAERSPIGTIKTLEAARADQVKLFHSRWYRPERAIVIISGDIDPVTSTQLIAKNFSGWKGEGPVPPEPDFGKPEAAQPMTASIAEPSLPQVTSFALIRPWTYRDDTIVFNQKRLVDLLALRLINRRLETRARSGGSYISANVTLDDVSRSANGTFIQILPVGDEWQAALRDVRAVIADAIAAPSAQAEIDREFSEFDSAMKTQVDTAAAEAGAKQADDLGEAVDIRETVTTPGVAYQILQDAKAKDMFSAEALLESTRRVLSIGIVRGIVNTRTPDPTAAAKLEAALKLDVSGLAAKRNTLKTVTFASLPKLGAPGKIVSRSVVTDLGMEQVVFANGVRLMVFANPSEANRVYVRVRFGGGYNALPVNRASSAWAAPLALVAGGIGTLGQEGLDQLTTGRRIGMEFGVDEDSFAFAATTSPADLADQLTLIATKMASPGWDPNPLARARAAASSSYAGFSASPGGILSRDLEGLLRGGDPRWATPTREQIIATTAQSFRALWEPLLQSGPVEVQVFGDVKADAAIYAVARSIGALKSRPASTRAAPPIKFAAPVTSPVIRRHDGPVNQAVAAIAWPTGGGIAGATEAIRLDLIAQIFGDRLFDRLRSEAGASYSPSVQSSWPTGLASGGRVIGIGQVPPDKVEFFFKLAREIAADLASEPIDADELKRTIVPYVQYLARASTGNTYWLNQLKGASYDPRRIAAVKALGATLAATTPALLAETARKYLKPETEWTLAVLPKEAAGARPAGVQ